MNAKVIKYRLKIKSAEVILVEGIVAECQSIAEGYHETIADRLFAKFGGQQTLKAQHHGVDIKSKRGEFK